LLQLLLLLFSWHIDDGAKLHILHCAGERIGLRFFAVVYTSELVRQLGRVAGCV